MTVRDCFRFVMRACVSARRNAGCDAPAKPRQCGLDTRSLQIGATRNLSLRDVQTRLTDRNDFARMERRIGNKMQDRRTVITSRLRVYRPVEPDLGFYGSVARQ